MQGSLSRVERAIAAVVEGGIERLFAGRVQPAQIAGQLESAMEDGILLGARTRIAPHSFIVKLDPRTYERYSPASARIERDLEGAVEAAAARRGAELLGTAIVRLQEDPALSRGRMRVVASFTPPEGSAPPSPEAAEHTMVMHGPAATAAVSSAAIELDGDGAEPLLLPIGAHAEFRIGRSDDNELVLVDPAVSRYHAAIRPSDRGYVIFDLDSSNGVRVNGERVRFARLADGDEIQVGSTLAHFRDGGVDAGARGRPA